MSRVVFLVAPSEAQGLQDAAARGWVRIARSRFVTQEKDDVRLACRMDDILVVPGGTLMIRGADYYSGPSGADAMNRWAECREGEGERARFEKFVDAGAGRWIEL